MEDTKLVRKNITITPTLDEMITKIKTKKGLKSFISVVELAVNELYSSTFKDYVMSRGEPRSKSTEQRAQDQIDIREIKRKKEEDKLLSIAEALGGRVSVANGGNKAVVYYTYDRKNRYQQQLPLHMMSEELLEAQYFPSKEEVLNLQEKGLVNYNPKTWE